MFNSHIAKKREIKLFKKLQQAKKEINWDSKYHQKIQPQLLAKYQQRINSFVHQMNENPIIIEQAKRDPQGQRHCRFTFKNAEDWKSIYTISQRLNLSKGKKSKVKLGNATIDVVPQRNSCFIDFQPIKIQYRHRNKLKQINHPMKFSINSKEEALRPTRKRNSSLQSMKQKQRQEQQIDYNKSNSRQKSIRDSDNISEIFDWRGRGEQEDHQQQQKQKEVNQKKIHYKKLMTLYLIGSNTEKKEIKQILDKSGYIRKRRAGTQTTEIDQFENIIEKK